MCISNRVIWSKQIKPLPQPLEPLFESAVAEGYGMVEWRSPTKSGTTVPETDLISRSDATAEIRRLSESCQIDMAYHAPQGDLWDFGVLPPQTAVDRLHECVNRAVSVGATYMTFHLGITVGDGREDGIRQGGDVVMSVLPESEKAGVCLCVENVFDNCSVATVDDCDVLFQHIDTSLVKLTLDTGHGNLCGCLHELVGSFSDRLAFAHIHDNNGLKDQHFVPGRGIIDWERLIEDLDRANYSGPLNFELREEATLCELKKHWHNCNG
ncbi:MAG: sugar phosphate isomerase/epimerase family protein [Candidatus Latescibacteria bacterium]|nr:sugar phosphate isomerase/epimerase family protein [Candidatus Latescibacterota bacterium]